MSYKKTKTEYFSTILESILVNFQMWIGVLEFITRLDSYNRQRELVEHPCSQKLMGWPLARTSLNLIRQNFKLKRLLHIFYQALDREGQSEGNLALPYSHNLLFQENFSFQG